MLKKTKLYFLNLILGITGLGIIVTFQNCSKIQASDISQPMAVTNPGVSGQSATLSCSFEGQTVDVGTQFTRYQNSSVAYGAQCVSEVRECKADGTMSGSFSLANCAVGAPQSCQFNGKTYKSGDTVMAYQNSSVGYGEKCQGETRLCTDGQWSGSYNYPTCEVGAARACQFNGQTIANGQSIKAARESSVAYGSKCEFEDRKCDNGTLSGSYMYASCNEGTAKSCLFNGRTIANGQTVEASRESSVPYGGKCLTETRKCENGTLSGSYTYPSCQVGTPRSCQFDGHTVANGESVMANRESHVPYGERCISEERTCLDGALSGSYAYGSCTVMDPICDKGYVLKNHICVKAGDDDDDSDHDRDCDKDDDHRDHKSEHHDMDRDHDRDHDRDDHKSHDGKKRKCEKDHDHEDHKSEHDKKNDDDDRDRRHERDQDHK